MSSANLLPPSAPPAEFSIQWWRSLFKISAFRRSTRFPTLWPVRSTTIASLPKNTNARESSLIGALQAPAFSRQRFPARVLAPLCLWLACGSSSSWRRWWMLRSRFVGADCRQQKARLEDQEVSRDYHARRCQAGYRQQTALQCFEQQRGVFPRVRHYPFGVSAI